MLEQVKKSAGQIETTDSYTKYHLKESIAIKGQNNSSMRIYKVIEWKSTGHIEYVTDEGSLFFDSWEIQ